MAKKDWTGDTHSTFVTLGASNHTDFEREVNDYYATEPKAVELLLEKEEFEGTIWENACGEGHISKVLEAHGYTVVSTDLIDRGYGTGGFDFLTYIGDSLGDNIITNPPYTYSTEWVSRSLELLEDGKKLAMFLPIQFLEGKDRRAIFDEMPPKVVYVSSSRLNCGMNGEFYERDENGNIKYKKNGEPKKIGSAKCYAWFVWVKGFKGDPIIKWIN